MNDFDPCKLYIWQLFAPFGMRKNRAKGLDFWEFINARNEPLGPPFKLVRKPSKKHLAAVHRGRKRADHVMFCDERTYGDKAYWQVLGMVYQWQLDTRAHSLCVPPKEDSTR